MSAQTDRYLKEMFGKADGWVALARKNGDDQWHEESFKWPQDGVIVTKWVDAHRDANVFVCPSLRAFQGRQKADMARGQCKWLWADVDMQTIPEKVRALVAERIADLGTRVVSSGSGDNVHVYVLLDAPVGVDEHFRLNTGLRDYLYADNKHPDNSLLRLPGTKNWKPGNDGSPVKYVEGNGQRVPVSKLMTLKAFKSVATRAAAEAEEQWEQVVVPALPSKLKRLLRMEEDEGIGRFRTRYGAVWAVAGELVKHGLTPDQVHTAMQAFDPGLAKENDERGYSMHKDIGRRIAQARDAREALDDALESGSELADDDSPFEDITEEDLAEAIEARGMDPNSPAVKRIRDQMEAHRIAKALDAELRFRRPPPETSTNMRDETDKTDRVREPQLIDGLCGAHHNVVLTAQYKTGKTTFLVSNILRSLIDGDPFLGKIAVNNSRWPVVGHWNLEMDADELVDDYVIPANITVLDDFEVWNGRGYHVDITTDAGKAWAVEWLSELSVTVWTIDSLARLLYMCGVSEKDNDEVLRVLASVDEIKMLAGVDVCFIITHTGRVEMEEGKERSRGATVIDDWADARWIMTKEGDVRFLTVDGRGVRMATTSLIFDADTGVCSLGVEGKGKALEGAGVQVVLQAVTELPGINQKALILDLKARAGWGLDKSRSMISEADECGFIEVRRIRNSAGRVENKHYAKVGNDGRGIGTANGKATPRVMDLSRG